MGKGADIQDEGSGKSTLSAKSIREDPGRQFKKIGDDLADCIEHTDLRKCDSLIYQKQDEESIKEPEVLQEPIHAEFEIPPVLEYGIDCAHSLLIIKKPAGSPKRQ